MKPRALFGGSKKKRTVSPGTHSLALFSMYGESELNTDDILLMLHKNFHGYTSWSSIDFPGKILE